MVRNGITMQEERAVVQAEGFESHATIKLLQKRNWYRADGTLVGLLPVDPYHEARFRAKGWSLHPSPNPASKEKHYLGFPDAVEAPVAPAVDPDEGRVPYIKENG